MELHGPRAFAQGLLLTRRRVNWLFPPTQSARFTTRSRYHMTLRVPLLACAFLSAATAFAADWPGFRGPNRDGICTETGLLKKWPDAGPKKLWSASGLGTGWGTPSVAYGKIYGTGLRDSKAGVWA